MRAAHIPGFLLRETKRCAEPSALYYAGLRKQSTTLTERATTQKGSIIQPLARIVALLREHWMLAASALAAGVSMLAVVPDAAYANYFDWKTIGCLFCVLAVATAFRNAGIFDRIAHTIIARIHHTRALTLTLVLITAVLSMAFTNDVALIVMLPLAGVILIRSNRTQLIPVAFSLQTIAANLCGMLTPFGNPQNIYLYSYYDLGLSEFFATMAFPFCAATAIIVITTHMMAKVRTKSTTCAPAHERDQQPQPQPCSPQRTVLYLALFALTLLAIFSLIPSIVAVIVVAGALLIADRKALAAVDYPLLVTFCCFFVFAGNMARIPALCEFLEPFMTNWGLLTSALTSQVISNVPAAVLLSHFTETWQPLLIGVNIGGAGTFVGSLASLIAIRSFSLVKHAFPRKEAGAPTTKQFLVTFGVLNMGFFVVLLALCSLAPSPVL